MDLDSSTNFIELASPKTEVDADNEVSKMQWTSENTTNLIEVFEKECRVLWDTKHAQYKDRAARQAKLEYLAIGFGTNSEEISRKLHNLRTQFNNELRKIKKRMVNGEPSGAGSSGWEYFESLLFLLREPFVDTNADMDSINLALAEFQADEEVEFETAVRARARLFVDMLRNLGEKLVDKHSPSPKLRKPTMRSPAPAPSPLPADRFSRWNEEPRIFSSNHYDDCKVFGDFVASELRMLRHSDARCKLKRIIQKAILQVAEEENSYVTN